ncbi:hypothetical protein JUN65_01935 [Gluconacetobacter azotocaptans]|uniref:DUF6874 family protein n=1 Tax=Gluconacetobacter azotocaptans TaxID=142834 RepID=UPI00195D4D8C|nr:hypothetical protein [Gluconacetobacter azotocaptans]MBM9400353.1 hypothetical protein [Gluconacetobacter azotocaptans]
MVKFDISREDRVRVRLIADRVVDVLISQGIEKASWRAFNLETRMDLTAVHANGCPMDFVRLLDVSESDLMHDVGGIKRHLDRQTGKLEGFFLPRTAKKGARV